MPAGTTRTSRTSPGQAVIQRKPPLRRPIRPTDSDEAYERVLRDIGSLSTLPEGWDSYKGAPISKEAQNRATAFIITLLTHLDWRVPPPTVGPSPTGGVVLRWISSRYDVMLNFLPEGGEYSVVDLQVNEVLDEGLIGRPESVIRDVINRFLPKESDEP